MDIEVAGLRLDGVVDSGELIKIDHANKIYIHNNWFMRTNVTKALLYIYYCYAIAKIENNVFGIPPEWESKLGENRHERAVVLQYAHESMVMFNHIYGSAVFGIVLNNCYDFQVIGNNLEKGGSGGSADAAIYLALSLTQWQTGIVAENHIEYWNYRGIHILNGRYLVIANNGINGVQYGIWAAYLYNSTIIGNRYYNYGYTGKYGIRLGASFHNVIENNIVHGIQSGYYAIIEESGSDYNIIRNNDVDGKIIVTGAYSIVNDNIGYTTEACGSVIIPAGTKSVLIDHGLSVAPNVVIVTTNDTSVTAAVVSIDSTSFNVTLSTTPSTPVLVYWHAEYKP